MSLNDLRPLNAAGDQYELAVMVAHIWDWIERQSDFFAPAIVCLTLAYVVWQVLCR